MKFALISIKPSPLFIPLGYHYDVNTINNES